MQLHTHISPNKCEINYFFSVGTQNQQFNVILTSPYVYKYPVLYTKWQLNVLYPKHIMRMTEEKQFFAES